MRQTVVEHERWRVGVDHGGEATDVIGVRVAGDHEGEVRDARVPEVSEHGAVVVAGVVHHAAAVG